MRICLLLIKILIEKISKNTFWKAKKKKNLKKLKKLFQRIIEQENQKDFQ